MRVGLYDTYVTAGSTTVALDLQVDEVVAALNTVLGSDDESGAVGLVDEGVPLAARAPSRRAAEALGWLVDAPR